MVVLVVADHRLITFSELATYHASSASSSATYLITVEVSPTKRMDVDDEEDEYGFDEEDEEEDMPEMKIVLVGEDGLECASLRPSLCCGCS
jgi:hypothetical protein